MIRQFGSGTPIGGTWTNNGIAANSNKFIGLLPEQGCIPFTILMKILTLVKI